MLSEALEKKLERFRTLLKTCECVRTIYLERSILFLALLDEQVKLKEDILRSEVNADIEHADEALITLKRIRMDRRLYDSIRRALYDIEHESTDVLQTLLKMRRSAVQLDCLLKL